MTTGYTAVDLLNEILRVFDRGSVDLSNDIAFPDSCIGCRTSGFDASHHHARIFIHPETLCNFRGEILNSDP